MNWYLRARNRSGAPKGSHASRQYVIFARQFKRHGLKGFFRRHGIFRGYDAYERARVDAEKARQRRIEAESRKRLGIGLYEKWPTYLWPGGYNAVYLVCDDIHSAAHGGVDATLCGKCLNERPQDVVVGVESGDGYDEPITCDDCGELLAGYAEESA